MPVYLAVKGLGERPSGPYAPIGLFRVRRLTQTQTSATPSPKADAANGCLVARTLSSTPGTDLEQRFLKMASEPQRERCASTTAARLWYAASDELYAGYPFSAPNQSGAA